MSLELINNFDISTADTLTCAVRGEEWALVSETAVAAMPAVDSSDGSSIAVPLEWQRCISRDLNARFLERMVNRVQDSVQIVKRDPLGLYIAIEGTLAVPGHLPPDATGIDQLRMLAARSRGNAAATFHAPCLVTLNGHTNLRIIVVGLVVVWNHWAIFDVEKPSRWKFPKAYFPILEVPFGNTCPKTSRCIETRCDFR